MSEEITIRLDKTDPHWVKLENPGGTASENAEWWINNATSSEQPRATIIIKLLEVLKRGGKAKIRWSSNDWFGIGLDKSKDGITWSPLWSKTGYYIFDNIFEIELDPECGYYRISFGDGNLSLEWTKVYKTVVLLLPPVAPIPTLCEQSFRIVTKGGESTPATFTISPSMYNDLPEKEGDLLSSVNIKTPIAFVMYANPGTKYTATAQASGYLTAQATFTACVGNIDNSLDLILTPLPAPPPPEKKRTRLTCYNKETEVNKEVKLEAKLELFYEQRWRNLADALVKFYVDGAFIGQSDTNWLGVATYYYEPLKSGTFTIKAVFDGTALYERAECTSTLTVREVVVAPPVKKTTRLTCYDKETEENKEVGLEAKLEFFEQWWRNLANALVKFYVDDVLVGQSPTTLSGIAAISYIPYYIPALAKAGSFTIKAIFEGTSEYEPAKCTSTLTVKEVAPPAPPPPAPPCPIAIAFVATPYVNDLNVLREFRDKSMPKWLVRLYYSVIAPPTARLIEKRSILKKAVRGAIRPIIRILKRWEF